MRLVFNKIPRWAKFLYCLGSLLLLIAMGLFYLWPTLLASVSVLQMFILGAIVVAIGSVINTLHQFKRPKPQKKE